MNDLNTQLDIPHYGNVTTILNKNDRARKQDPMQDPVVDQIIPEQDPDNRAPAEIDPKSQKPRDKEPPLSQEEELDPSKNPMRVDLWEGVEVWM